MNAYTDSRERLANRIRQRAYEMGFDAVGIAPVEASAHAEAYRRWVDRGFAGEMSYLTGEDAVAKRADPVHVVEGARSAIVVVKNYYPSPDEEGEGDPSRGVFARYARNEDYHDVLTPRLIALQEWIDRVLLRARGRAYVDTGPVLEREIATSAGLGWAGRNTMLIRPGMGSYIFLGTLLLDVELEYDEPFEEDRCGSCTRCVTACPTDALLGRDERGAPVMDARRCISYLTIELKGPIPRELRSLIGNRVYGCDICQEVCPWNSEKFVQLTDEPAFRAREGVHGAELIELMRLTPEGFRERFRKSPVKRAKRRGLLRNVAVALGNWGSERAVPVLIEALGDGEPLVRGHAAWALGRISAGDAASERVGSEIGRALGKRLAVEEDGWVREEVELALSA